MTTSMTDLPAALEAAGVNVRVLDGWDTPAQSGYYWREDNDNPAGAMWHHTATTSYTPNRDKANGYAGLSMNGSDRLYQEDYGDGDFQPVYTIANAYPAPISSGAGDYSVLERVRAGLEVVGRQGPDTPNWYGNTHYWNTEVVLNGIGSPIDQKVWDMMLTVSDVLNDLMGWTPYHHISHGHHTRRKIDLWGGQFSNTNKDGFDKTIIALREQMGDNMTWADIVTDETWTKAYEDGFIKGDPKVMPEYYFADGPASEAEKKNGYNVIMQAQMEATK